jgi:ribosomal protein S18 acetylase RimI-like enzyme
MIIRVETAEHLQQARSLFEEYADSLGVDLSFQNFDEELANLPGDYAPPDGCLLLAQHEGQPAGCIALRKISGDTCEMKRLYVRDDCRGHGFGRMLVQMIIAEAQRLGYKWMRLDTLPSMIEAKALYRNFGFREIEPYRYNPILGTSFLQLDLSE